jgi:hypothetical protein
VLRAAAIAAALFACAMPAFAQQGQGCDDLRGQPINFGVQWQEDVKPIINELLGGRCTSCHNEGSPSGGLNLTDVPVDAIYNMAGFVVFPSDVPNSILFDKVNCEFPGSGGARMPRDATPLTLAEQALIYDWIEQGAQGEPKDPINRDVLFRDGAESLRFY